MEIKDVQFSVDGKWSDWFIETADQKAKQESMAAEESARLEREQANEKAAAEKMEKKQKQDEERRIAWTRTWKDKSGNFSIDAEMLKMSNGVLTLKRVSDGVEIKVSLEKLSQECNDWVSEAIRKR